MQTQPGMRTLLGQRHEGRSHRQLALALRIRSTLALRAQRSREHSPWLRGVIEGEMLQETSNFLCVSDTDRGERNLSSQSKHGISVIRVIN